MTVHRSVPRLPSASVFRRALPLLAATVLVACSGGDQSGSTAATGATTTQSSSTTAGSTAASTAGSTAGSIEVPPALQFTAPLVGGGEIELGALAGRPVLLWFWAPW